MLRYRLTLEPDDNGTVLVTSPDLPIATYGENESDALRNAADAIKTVIESMMSTREEVPIPVFRSGTSVPVHEMSLQTELKVRLHQAMIEAGLNRAELARRLEWNRESVDRLFRLDHRSRLDRIDQAFAALGRRVDIDIREAA